MTKCSNQIMHFLTHQPFHQTSLSSPHIYWWCHFEFFTYFSNCDHLDIPIFHRNCILDWGK
jgi:hypothetical protein